MDTGTPISWKDEAKEDLRDILHYLSRSSSVYVENWSNELTKKLEFPEMGCKVPEKELNHLREVLIGNYRLLYIYLHDTITIIALRHQASQLGKL